MGKKKIVILSVLGLAFLGIIYIPGYLKIRRMDRQSKELARQIEELKQANQGLAEEQIRPQG